MNNEDFFLLLVVMKCQVLLCQCGIRIKYEGRLLKIFTNYIELLIKFHILQKHLSIYGQLIVLHGFRNKKKIAA
jgi:hypothetical protein